MALNWYSSLVCSAWKHGHIGLNNNYCAHLASQGDIKIKVWKIWILTDRRDEYCVVQKVRSTHKLDNREWIDPVLELL